MVGEYSRPSSNSASPAESGWSAALIRLRRVEELLRALVTRDSHVYAALRAATQHRKEHVDADGLYRKAVLEAVAVPLEIAALAAEVLSILEAHRSQVGKYMLSDLGAAAWTLEAAARAARLMVLVNLTSLADAHAREKIRADVEAVVDRCTRIRSVIVA
jgi:formiminotetrahydrofolate cyclodeaminase